MLAIILALLGIGIYWGITVLSIYLICLCFSLKFSLLVATGIWLVIIILKSIFKK